MIALPFWTPARRRVLRILSDASAPVWALDVAKSTGMTYGTVYASFRALYDMGWAVGVTEEVHTGRPARVKYRLTAVGRAGAEALLSEKETQ